MMLQAVNTGSSSPGPQAEQAATNPANASTSRTSNDAAAPQQQTQQLHTPTPMQPVQDDPLRSAALRMRLEMPLKERIIHLQTFKYTFTGQQAVGFLQQQGLAANADVAADMCQRMLTQGMFKSIYHREVFLPDAEVYRFSSSFPDGNKQKNRIPGSITSTGLYKEIAKIGKTAAQPFKNIQLSLNDTFNSIGSNLSIPTSAHNNKPPGQLLGIGGLVGGGGAGGASTRPRSSGSGATRSMLRRSQTGKLHHVYSEGHAHHHGLQDSSSHSLAALLGSMDALQASVKESTSLLRLDLQQHTALQEHLVGILMAQQDQMRFTQLLIAINAAAALLLLGFSGTWTAALASASLLLLLLYGFGPDIASRIASRQPQPSSSMGGGLLRRSSVGAVRGGLEPSLSRLSRQAGVQPASRAAAEAGSLGGFAGPRGAAHAEDDDDDEEGVGHGIIRERESDDEVQELVEDSIPYSEDFDDWPDAPVMLCPDPAAAQQEFAVEGPGPCHALAANGDPIPFESELFKGVVAVYIRHLPTTPNQLFKGKKRLAWVALQGTFKQPVVMDNLVYGMEFRRQLTNLPAPWFLENMLLPLARKISPNLRVGTLEDPYFFSPIITASQVVNVSLPGEAPPLMEAKEDIRLLQQELGGKAGDGLTVSARRRYFQAASNRLLPYSTEYVWTFHLWQEYIDYASYMLNLGYSSYDLTQHLDGQPLQLNAKDESTGQQLVSLHVWHANLVRCLTRRMPRRNRMSRRVSNVSQEDALQDRSVQVSEAGAEPDSLTPSAAAAAAAAAVSSPTAAGLLQQQQQQTPELQQQQEQPDQQQQQTHSSPLPSVNISPLQLEQRLSDFQQQQQQQQQQVSSPQHQQQQQQQQVSSPQHQQQRSGRASGSSALHQQQQPQHHVPCSSLSDSRLQRPTGLKGYRDSGGGGSTSDTEGASVGSGGNTTPLSLSSLRPQAQLSGGAAAAGSAAGSASVSASGGVGGVGLLQQQLSLPAQQLGGSQRDMQVPRAELQSISTSGGSSGGGGRSSAAAAAAAAAEGVCGVGSTTGSRPPVAGAGGSAAASLHTDSSWAAASARPTVVSGCSSGSNNSRSARVSSSAGATAGAAGAAIAGEGSGVMSSDGGVDSPVACRTPRHPSVGGAGAVVAGGGPAAAAAASGSAAAAAGAAGSSPGLLLRQQHSSKKKREPRDKEEQQRQQLHGLSVMGAL